MATKNTKFTLTEQEAHFLEHTRILTKNRKCYPGKQKPVSNEIPEYTTVPRPQVIKGSFKFWCHECFQDYIDWDQHQEICNGKPFGNCFCEFCVT